jgi:hypothetical protein
VFFLLLVACGYVAAQPTPPTGIALSTINTFPNASNTGVPAGTTLTTYTGPCTITAANTVIDAKDFRPTCTGLDIRTTGVVIRRSIIQGPIDMDNGTNNSLTIETSRVYGDEDTLLKMPAIRGQNLTAKYLHVTGGQHNIQCKTNCTIEYSYLVNQWNPNGFDFHNNAFIANEGDNMNIRFNTLFCDAILNATDGGCTADLSLIADFSPIYNVLIEGNLFKSNGANSSAGYCLHLPEEPGKPYGNSAQNCTNVRVINNIFERKASSTHPVNGACGVFGTVTSSCGTGRAGYVWSGNKFYPDGATVSPDE